MSPHTLPSSPSTPRVQFSMTAIVMPTTPSTASSTFVPSEDQFTNTNHALATPHPHRSRRVLHQKLESDMPNPVQSEDLFAKTSPLLLPSTSASSGTPSKSASVMQSRSSRKTTVKSPILRKTPMKKMSCTSPSFRTRMMVATQLPNPSFLHGKFPKPNISFLHSSKAPALTRHTQKLN